MMQHMLLNEQQADSAVYTRACKEAGSAHVVSRREDQHAKVNHRVQVGAARSASRTFTPLEEAVKDATNSHLARTGTPEGFGLVHLSARKYPKAEMVKTIVARESGTIAGFDEAVRARELLGMSAEALRSHIVFVFYGDEWGAQYAPKNAPRNDQDQAVAAAKENSSSEMIEAKKAWAWKLDIKAAVDAIARENGAKIGALNTK